MEPSIEFIGNLRKRWFLVVEGMAVSIKLGILLVGVLVLSSSLIIR